MFVLIFVFVVMVIMIIVFVFGVKNGAVGNVEITEVRLFEGGADVDPSQICLLYTSPSPRDVEEYRMPSSG